MSKLRSSVDAFIKTGGSYAKLDHLTAMEINSIRPLLPHALDELYKLQKVVRIFMNFLKNMTSTMSGVSRKVF
jgi:GINS complex subunit 2